MLATSILTRTEDLDGLGDPWEGLVERCPWATPFQTPAWQRTGVLADPRVQRFHGELCRRMVRAGRLRLWALRLDGRCLAVFCGFGFRRTTYA